MEQIKLPTGERIWQERLANGLMVMILPRPGFLRTYGILSTHYGSLDSRFKTPSKGIVDVPPGIAHFLEHKLFEEEEGNVFDRFAKWGASVNAFTSYSQTSYLFSTTENWQDCLTTLIEFVNSPHLTAENVEKEKGIIEQELRMYEDHPNHRIHTLLLESLYQENPVRLDIGGTVDSVYRITVEDLMTCYDTFYQPSNMALSVVGNVDPQETLDLIKRSYPSWPREQTAIERIFPKEPREIVQSRVEEKLSISRPRYLLGFKHDPMWQGEELIRQQIAMSIALKLIAGRSSNVYERLYEADLVSDSFGASFSAHPQYAHSVIGSETSDPDALHEELTKIINELKQGGVDVNDVERLKRQIYGQYLASLDSFEYTANRLISHYFNDTSWHTYLESLQAVTANEVQQAISQHLDWDRSSVSILLPVEPHD